MNLRRGKAELGEEGIGDCSARGDVAVGRGGDAPRCLGALVDLPRYMDQHRGEFDQLWVSMTPGDAGDMKAMLKQIERFPVPVRLIPDTTGWGTMNPGVHQVGNVPMIGVRQGLSDHNFRLAKRVEDIVVAGLAVIALAPVFAVLAIGVKLSSPGPVLFRQRRHGLGGKEFSMSKFPSLRALA